MRYSRIQIYVVILCAMVVFAPGGCATRVRTVQGTLKPTYVADRSGRIYRIAAIRADSGVDWPVAWERGVIERLGVDVVDSQNRVVLFERFNDPEQRRFRGRFKRVVLLSPDGTDTVGAESHIGTRRQEYELPTLAFVIDSVPDN